jgi:anthranilate synthase component 1
VSGDAGDSAGTSWRTITAPADLAVLHAANPARYPHLLESVAHGTPPGRFDILFAFPGRTLALGGDGVLREEGDPCSDADFVTALDRAWRSESIADTGETPVPFRGGWFLFLSYELVAQLEPRFVTLPRDADLPVAQATRFPAAVVRDRLRNLTYLVCECGQDHLLDAMQRDIAASTRSESAEPVIVALEEEPANVYLAHVRRIKEYIAAGDVFQVNLSRRWRAALAHATAPVAIYRRLRAANPAPFSGLMSIPGGAIISSSPERLVEVQQRTVRTRPIAGTYPRSGDPDVDQRRARELLAHPKERAEHVMLIDLERNDLGRVCRPGSVRVSELMALESYRHVHHIVSEVCGELRDRVTPGEVIRAVFPGGTITGCPKVRCMEIIAELERTPRGAYTGSMGYLNRDGSLDLNILIRTLVQTGPALSFRAGAGIVADSVPERELNETRAKARGLLAALGVR